MNKRAIVLAGIVFPLIAQITPLCSAQEVPAPVKAKEVIGLTGVKDNAKGTLRAESGKLIFAHGKVHSDIGAVAISDIVTGADSARAVGGTVGTMSMAAPYGSGRFLSLFRKKIDTLTIQYRDGDGSLHGVIFAMPVGAAEGIRKDLVAQGATTAAPAPPDQGPTDPSPSPRNEENIAPGSGQTPVKAKTTAVQVKMIQSGEINVPAEFRIALYENLVKQLEKKGKFQHVYRDGDSNASGAPDLVVLHSSIQGFKGGSERARQVTTVAGATSIKVHCQFTTAAGQTLIERDVNGKVRFFGGNLRATYDFAKKAAQITDNNLSVSKPAQ
jgi:hypothetical protein